MPVRVYVRSVDSARRNAWVPVVLICGRQPARDVAFTASLPAVAPSRRVLHRVTFVNRILPPVRTTRAGSLDETLPSVDLASNYDLVRATRGGTSESAGRCPRLSLTSVRFQGL